MRVLLLKYTSLGWEDLWQSLIALGYEVDCVEYFPRGFEEDSKLEECLTQRCLEKCFDAVMSFNYFQVISKVCNHHQILYISWVWDSPILTLYSPTVYNPCNFIFIFDKILFQKLKKQGINTVYHLPLAANHIRLNQMESEIVDDDQYSAEVSFVGRLYIKRISYDSLRISSDYNKGFLEGCMQAQTYIQGYNFLKEILTDETINTIQEEHKFHLGDKFTGDFKQLVADVFLGVKVTQMERINTLKLLSEHFSVSLYTDDKTEMLPQLQNKGYVDYYTQMPYVFRNSKINLNISHRTIQSGIPLRVFDILGAGGFLITNYQPELTELFVDGEDLVIYYSYMDLVEKVRYYLANDAERCRIARNGCRKVREQHNYCKRLTDIFHIVGNGHQGAEDMV